MKSYVLAAVALGGFATSAQAVTIAFDPGAANPLPSTVSVIQSFTTPAANGSAFATNQTTLGAPGVSQASTGTVNLYNQAVTPGEAVGPVPLAGSFLSILNGTYSIAFGSGVRYLSFLIGGLDSYNSVTLTTSAGSTTFTGREMIGLANTGGPNFGDTGRVTFNFSQSEAPLLSVLFSSSQAAFEIDEIAAAVPEPGTWAMMILGFGIAGWQLRARRKPDGKLAIA